PLVEHYVALLDLVLRELVGVLVQAGGHGVLPFYLDGGYGRAGAGRRLREWSTRRSSRPSGARPPTCRPTSRSARPRGAAGRGRSACPAARRGTSSPNFLPS